MQSSPYASALLYSWHCPTKQFIANILIITELALITPHPPVEELVSNSSGKLSVGVNPGEPERGGLRSGSKVEVGPIYIPTAQTNPISTRLYMLLRVPFRPISQISIFPPHATERGICRNQRIIYAAAEEVG